MKGGVEVKVCGITRAPDAELAADLGAGFLGFNFHPASPRAIDYATFDDLRPNLPPAKRVYVQVRPRVDELQRALEADFHFFQLHFPAAEDAGLVEQWAAIVSPAKLWLAPKIAPGEDFPAHLLPFAETFLLDTYRRNVYGGTGEAGDWKRFREWAAKWPEKRWILAGGLRPENVAAALRETGTSFIDVNSGVEERPGWKNPERMRALFAVLGA